MAGFGAYGGFGLGEGLAAAGANSMGNGLGEFGATAGQGTGADYAKFLGDTGQKAVSNMPEAAVNVGSSVGNTAANNLGGLNAYQAQGYNNIFANPNYGNYTPINNLGEVSQMPISGTASTPLDVTQGVPKEYVGQNWTSSTYGNPQAAPGLEVKTIYEGSSTPYKYTSDLAKVQNDPLMEPVATYQTGKYVPPPSYMDKVGAGFKDVTSSGDKAWQFVKSNPAPFVTAGLGLAQDLMGNKSGAAAPSSGPSYLRPYDFSVEQDPNAYLASNSTAERRYFKEPRYKAKPIERIAAAGGLMRMAEGGATLALPDRPPVEQATDEQAIGQNMSFPMANQRHPAYSAPTNRPIMHEVVDPSGGPEVDPYTGEPRFANGGIAHYEIGGLTLAAKKAEPTTDTKYAYNPETMQYTETVTSTPAAKNNPFGMLGMGLAGIGGGMVPLGLAQNFAGLHPMFAGLAKQQQAPQPTVTTETSGGVAAPYIPEGQAQAQPQMQAANPIAPNINVPQYQTPEQQLGLTDFYSMMDQQLAKKGAQMQGLAGGGVAGNSHLGGYSDGGRLLKGPGDGVSDSIPAVIGRRQPARLADGEFVVPARIVSEIGNGSTEAGARKLYAMMDRVQKARRKTVGKGKVAVNSKSERFLPA